MSEDSLVSFVVVTHDRPIEIVIDRIIRSIALQDHARRELILIGENCPHLGLMAGLIESRFPGLLTHWFNEPRSLLELSSPWARVGRCRNRGVWMAQGQFISCQDDDNELEEDFCSSLLSCLFANNADAAWCHRRLVMPDGSPYPGTFFPWAEPLSIRGRLLYNMWVEAGVLTDGSDIVRDQLLARNSSEIFSTVDASAWLAKAEIYRQFPFRERFGHQDLISNTSFDDIWNRDIRTAGARVACSELPSLIYHLGGEGNAELVAQWLVHSSKCI